MATNHDALTLKVESKITTLVKPSQPTPSQLLSFSTVDNDPNLEILCQSIYVYKAKDIDDSTNNIDPAILIQEALSKVLVYYYPLAGRLKRNNDKKLEMNCNGQGVPFSVAQANCTLSSLNYFDGIDADLATQFVYELDSNDSIATHVLAMQVTKFACGGFTIGMGLSHSVCDGFGAAQFFRAMAELASGKSQCSVRPVWRRELLVASLESTNMIEPPLTSEAVIPMATSPYLPSTDLVHKCFNVGYQSIRRLKAYLMKDTISEGDQSLNPTTVEVLGAYIWRSRARALALNGKTRLILTVGIRHLLDPPLEKGYYGNAFVGSKIELMAREVSEGPLHEVVKLIKEAKIKASQKGYIRSWLGFMERFNQQGVRLEGSGANMVLTDWRQLGLLEEVDFGWKGAVNVIPVPWKMFGYVDLCIFMPPFSLDASMKGGVRVLVCLPRDAMTKFKEEMDALKLEEYNF